MNQQPRDAWKWWPKLVDLVDAIRPDRGIPLTDEAVFDWAKVYLQQRKSPLGDARRELSEVGIEASTVEDGVTAAVDEIRELRDQVATLRGQLAERERDAGKAVLWGNLADLVHELDHRGDGRMGDDDTYDIVARVLRSHVHAAEDLRQQRARVAELEGLIARVGIGTPGGETAADAPPKLTPSEALAKLRELNAFEGVDIEAMMNELRGEDPIPMVLFCPACGRQHVDAPNPAEGWDNPPHRSHKCGACAHVWRPADVPTAGVETIATVGQVDTVPVVRNRVRAVTKAGLVHVIDDELLKQDLAELWDRRKADRTYGSAEQRLSRAMHVLIDAGAGSGDFEFLLYRAVAALGYRKAIESCYPTVDLAAYVAHLNALERIREEDAIREPVNEGDSNLEPRPENGPEDDQFGPPEEDERGVAMMLAVSSEVCCWKCTPTFRGMLLCTSCGNKRCPHASDHDLACTKSNEPGQVGSVYAGPLGRSYPPKGEQEDR